MATLVTTIGEIRDTVNYFYRKQGPSLVSYVLANVAYFKRNKKSEKDIKYYTIDDLIIDSKAKLPELDDAIRKDVREFFTNQMTNLVNRTLFNTYAEIEFVEGEPDQSTIVIEDYNNDREELEEYLMTQNAEKSLKLMNERILKLDVLKNEVNDFEKTLEELIEIDDTDVIPVIWFTPINGVFGKKHKIKNSLLDEGKALIVKSHHLPDIKISSINSETLYFTDNGIYTLDITYMGNKSMRKVSLNEYLEYGKYPY